MEDGVYPRDTQWIRERKLLGKTEECENEDDLYIRGSNWIKRRQLMKGRAVKGSPDCRILGALIRYFVFVGICESGQLLSLLTCYWFRSCATDRITKRGVRGSIFAFERSQGEGACSTESAGVACYCNTL